MSRCSANEGSLLREQIASLCFDDQVDDDSVNRTFFWLVDLGAASHSCHDLEEKTPLLAELVALVKALMESA